MKYLIFDFFLNSAIKYAFHGAVTYPLMDKLENSIRLDFNDPLNPIECDKFKNAETISLFTVIVL